jgi:hypothetical protein
VVKIYAPGRPGIEEEILVYQQLGEHPAFSKCFYASRNFLVLKRFYGVTLYDCLHQGLKIPKQVILDVDAALDYARSQGLRPHDVHGRNVILEEGRGVVVDISDFLHEGDRSTSWSDLRWGYYWIYRPFLSRLSWCVPYFLLNLIRKFHRWLRR